ncbi:MAG TPA: sigma-70 family RNA polymerase sigma factor [Saprospiraceae bacterium]|nr:sigma-70 family RNA polymerase sigma factor [Saprospiraceae bacterium]
MDYSLNLTHTEANIISACLAKQAWAQQKLYEQYYPKLMAISLRYASGEDEALDILHEGFIKIFKNIDKYQPNTSLIAWMKTIMINTAIDQYRKNSKHRTENIDAVYDLAQRGADAVSMVNEQDIMKCIQSLTPAYRSVFNLYVIEGYSHKEIGELLNITESTSRSNLVKARAKLKDMLSGSYQSLED